MRYRGFVIAAAAAASLVGCGQQQGGGQSAGSGPAPAAAANSAQKQALLAELPAPYNAGDLANGEAKFAMCRSCHTTVSGGSNMTGPNLHGVFGVKAASRPDGFKYSDALKASGLTWDAVTLDKWIADPRSTAPGSKMSFAGLKDPKDRIDVIAYLKTETSDPR